MPEQSLGALRAAAQGKGVSRSSKVRVFEWLSEAIVITFWLAM
jgi:hypothetical protein